MKLNRRRGATLGLVAVAVLVIIVLGVGFFILSQILGGGREVANATDAGVLNVARKALSPTLIQVPIGADTEDEPRRDFLGVGVNKDGMANSGIGTNDGSHNRISMLALNRIVAQSIIVALNAQELGTSEAAGHARDVAKAARNISTSLKAVIEGSSAGASLSPAPLLDPHFRTVAESNNTKMFQGNKVQLTGLQSAFMRPNMSTNVYITANLQDAINVSLPPELKNQNANALTHDIGGQERYIAGYVPFSIPVGSGGPVEIAGVPIFPKQKPHLVDNGEFGRSGTAVAAYLPPNAFRANTRTQDNNSGGFGGAVACALVGALDQDFAAAVPRGYIRIRNGQDAGLARPDVLSQPVVDAGTDIFNNELWGPAGGVDVSNNVGDGSVYALNSSTGADSMTAWNAYNGGATARPNGGAGFTPTGPDRVAGETVDDDLLVPGVSVTTTSGPGFRAAKIKDLKLVSTIKKDCEAQTGWEEPACLFGDGSINPAPGTLINALINQYMAAQGTNSNPDPNGHGYTAVEVQKYDLLSKRFGSGRCSTVLPVKGPAGGEYGLKKFNPGNGYCANQAHPAVAFGEPGSPLDLIHQIGGAAPDVTHATGGCEPQLLERLLDRIRQADPSITMIQLKGALGSAAPEHKLELSGSLFLHCPGPNTLQLSEGGASTYFREDPSKVPAPGPTGLAADGPAVAPLQYLCENEYNIANNIVNANQGKPGASCASKGDANFHQAPYTDGPGELLAKDKAVWTPASGFRNLLGDLHFQNEANGTGTFCKPN